MFMRMRGIDSPIGLSRRVTAPARKAVTAPSSQQIRVSPAPVSQSTGAQHTGVVAAFQTKVSKASPRPVTDKPVNYSPISVVRNRKQRADQSSTAAAVTASPQRSSTGNVNGLVAGLSSSTVPAQTSVGAKRAVARRRETPTSKGGDVNVAAWAQRLGRAVLKRTSVVKEQLTSDLGQKSSSADSAKPSVPIITDLQRGFGGGKTQTRLNTMDPDGLNAARSAGTASGEPATAAPTAPDQSSGLYFPQEDVPVAAETSAKNPPVSTSPEASTKTMASGEKVILHKDGEITFKTADGQAITAEKVGENTMTEERYYLSLAAATATNFVVASATQRATIGVLNGIPNATSQALGQGAVAPMSLSESQWVNAGITAAASAAEQRTGLFGVPLPGTKEVLFYREVEPDKWMKIRVVVSPDGSISVPEDGWTPLNG